MSEPIQIFIKHWLNMFKQPMILVIFLENKHIYVKTMSTRSNAMKICRLI